VLLEQEIDLNFNPLNK
jgi:Calpain family cysteine protease